MCIYVGCISISWCYEEGIEVLTRYELQMIRLETIFLNATVTISALHSFTACAFLY